MSILSFVGSHVGSETESPIAGLKRISQSLAARLRRRKQEWLLREELAGLSDRSLLDIGIAEDEIYRVRAKDSFTPRAWLDEKGSARRCDV
jgi:uncharacterized protein YjiS (DUF1127 family)